MLFEKGIEVGHIRYGWYKNELFRLPFDNYPLKHIQVKFQDRKDTIGPYPVMIIAHYNRSLKWIEDNTKIVNWNELDVTPEDLERFIG
jgi:hypothetical protein